MIAIKILQQLTGFVGAPGADEQDREGAYRFRIAGPKLTRKAIGFFGLGIVVVVGEKIRLCRRHVRIGLESLGRTKSFRVGE